MEFLMGYVNAEDTADFNDHIRIGDAMSVCSRRCPQFKIWKNKTYLDFECDSLWWEAIDLMVGDKFALAFNFETGECRALYNGLPLGIISNNVPHSIYLAASLYDSPGSIWRTTKYVVL